MFHPRFHTVLRLAGLLILTGACKENQIQDPGPLTETFDLIQSRILTPSCAITDCHASTSDLSFTEHGLVLEKSVAYGSLVDITPVNHNAAAAGLLRVKPSDPDLSLFLHKLHIDNHHSTDYGNPMPLGLQKLSVGQVEFIEQWITAGAPLKGKVADTALLDDITSQDESFEPLEPPAAGNGFQVNLSLFTISPKFEREFFVYKKVGNAADVFVNRFEIKMRSNSHHLVIYDFDPAMTPLLLPQQDVVRDIRNPDNSLNIINMLPMPYHIFVFGAQSPYLNYEFPPGVALRIKAGASLDFNSHYVNKEPHSISGEVNVNFHTVPQAAVVKEAMTLNMGNTTLVLNPGQVSTISKSFTVGNAISVIALTSHTHQLGQKFVIRIVGGSRNNEIVYTSTDWHHPLYITYDPPIQLQAGEGLMSEITYNNTKANVVRFGLTSEDEMGIIFGYYTIN